RAGRTTRPSAPDLRSGPWWRSARRSRRVQGAVQLLEPAVDLQRHDATARAEPARDVRGGDEVGPGRRTGEDAELAGRAASHRERVRFRYRDDLVVLAGTEQRGAPAGATAFDAMRPGRLARQHRRLGGLDHHPMQIREPRAQRADRAEET